MQSDISLHPSTPRYDEKFENDVANDALTAAVFAGRNFSFLLSADDLAVRARQMTPAYQSAMALSRSYGYGTGRYNGD